MFCYERGTPVPNMEHIRQSRPDSGLGLRVKVLKTFESVPLSLDYFFDPVSLFESASIILHVAEKEVQLSPP